MKRYLGNKVAIILFSFPALAVFSAIIFWPILQVGYRSFFEWDGLKKAVFIGLDNYRNLLKDELFYISLKNGAIFAFLITFFQLGLATILALAVSSGNVLGKRFLRISYFIPVVLSITVVCQLWLAIFNNQFGLLNKLFELLGMEYRQAWLSNEKTAIWAVGFTNAWQYMGLHFALLTAGIKSIPEYYFEAATIDGCTKARAHWHITIPMLQETYKFCLVMAVTGGFNAFANMFIMTKGGPGVATYSMTYLMYRSAFRINQFGYGSAVAVALVVECLTATIVINRLVARERLTY